MLCHSTKVDRVTATKSGVIPASEDSGDSRFRQWELEKQTDRERVITWAHRYRAHNTQPSVLVCWYFAVQATANKLINQRRDGRPTHSRKNSEQARSDENYRQPHSARNELFRWERVQAVSSHSSTHRSFEVSRSKPYRCIEVELLVVGERSIVMSVSVCVCLSVREHKR